MNPLSSIAAARNVRGRAFVLDHGAATVFTRLARKEPFGKSAAVGTQVSDPCQLDSLIAFPGCEGPVHRLARRKFAGAVGVFAVDGRG